VSLDDEMQALMQSHRNYMAELARLELEKSADLIERFKILAASKGVTLTSESISYIETIGIVAFAPGLATVLGGVVSTERDGLFAYDEIAKCLPPRRFQEGYFIGSDYMVMAHPYFRRGMSPVANWAPRFVELFWGLNTPNAKKYIAIDENRVRINVDCSVYMEADSWYGAPFNDDVSKIKNGVTKLRPPPDMKSMYIDTYFAKAHCLDIKWSESNQVKTFQALELKVHSVQVIEGCETFFPARYLHAEFDMSCGEFRHFDGAIQLFTEEEYLRRRDSDFNMQFKNIEHVKARSKKIFKINGSLSVKSWVELCCHFFAANPLTFEYFTGSPPQHIIELVEKIRSRSK
jgi:hypothetical protein